MGLVSGVRQTWQVMRFLPFGDSGPVVGAKAAFRPPSCGRLLFGAGPKAERFVQAAADVAQAARVGPVVLATIGFFLVEQALHLVKCRLDLVDSGGCGLLCALVSLGGSGGHLVSPLRLGVLDSLILSYHRSWSLSIGKIGKRQNWWESGVAIEYGSLKLR